MSSPAKKDQKRMFGGALRKLRGKKSGSSPTKSSAAKTSSNANGSGRSSDSDNDDYSSGDVVESDVDDDDMDNFSFEGGKFSDDEVVSENNNTNSDAGSVKSDNSDDGSSVFVEDDDKEEVNITSIEASFESDDESGEVYLFVDDDDENSEQGEHFVEPTLPEPVLDLNEFESDPRVALQSPSTTNHDGEEGVTEIDTKRMPSFNVSTKEIDAIMESDSPTRTNMGHEDGEDLLAQLDMIDNNVLRSKSEDDDDFESDEDYDNNNSDEEYLEKELESAENLTAELTKMVEASNGTTQSPGLELHNSTHTENETEGAKNYSSQSSKHTSISLTNVQTSKAVEISSLIHYSIQSSERTEYIKTPDEQDENFSTAINPSAVDKQKLTRTESKTDSDNESATVQKVSANARNITEELNLFVSTEMNEEEIEESQKSSKKENRPIQMQARSPAEIRLRASMEKAKNMERVGEQLRMDPSCQYGEDEKDMNDSKEGLFQNSSEEFRHSAQRADLQLAEVYELRSRLQEQQQQIEGLEHERDFHASKVYELTDLLRLNGKDDINEKLTQNSSELAELGIEVTKLRRKLAESEDKASKLEAERDANKAIVLQLSEELWSNGKAKGSTSSSEAVANAFIKQGGVIPQNDAMQMTIESLQRKIELLEEEKSAFMQTVDSLTATVVELTQENEARTYKISALESQFRMLNERNNPHNVSGPPATVIETAPFSPVKKEKSLRFKTWANNRLNQAQEQYQNIKQDIEARRITSNPDQILS